MAGGVPAWAQTGTKGSGETVAVHSRPKKAPIDQDTSGTSVAGSGGSETVEVYAPAGSIYRLKALRLRAASIGAATTGTHLFKVIMSNPSVDLIRGESNYNSRVQHNFGHWFEADVGTEPGTDEAVVSILREQVITENDPLRMFYLNQTDAAQGSDRYYRLHCEEVSY